MAYGYAQAQQQVAAPAVDYSYSGKRRTAGEVVVAVGAVLLLLLCIVPVWDAIALLADPSYVFWLGRGTPVAMILASVSVITLYAATMLLFFQHGRPEFQTDLTVMMIATVFVTLLGLSLILIGLPLTQDAANMYSNLKEHCETSPQTQRLYEQSQALQELRREPTCAKKFSVDQCAGYGDASIAEGDGALNAFLRASEARFRCSGFCYRPPTAPADPTTPMVYPPTLFSDKNYKVSCEGMMARDLRNFAEDIGSQTLLQGICLVVTAVLVGFLKIAGFCRSGAHAAKPPPDYGAARA